VLQNYPGESVQVRGWLNIQGPDYWRIDGLWWRWDATMTGSAQSVVSIFGGTGWTFTHNRVSETRGVANLLVRSLPGASTQSERIAAAPHDYSIVGNLIVQQQGSDKGLDHNIYLLASIWSTGGLISHNLISGAPNGANIKVAGSQDWNEAPWDVKIENNTLLFASVGVVVGQKARYITITNNVIGRPLNSGKYDGGVKAYSLMYAGNVAVKDNVISGYASPIREQWGLPKSKLMFVRRTTDWPVTYSGSVPEGTATLTNKSIAGTFGHLAP
jgi:hypothetical protein